LQGLSEQPQSFFFSPTLFFLSLLFFSQGLSEQPQSAE